MWENWVKKNMETLFGNMRKGSGLIKKEIKKRKKLFDTNVEKFNLYEPRMITISCSTRQTNYL